MDEQVLGLSAGRWGQVGLVLGAVLALGHCQGQSGHSLQALSGREAGRMQSVGRGPWPHSPVCHHDVRPVRV